MKTLVPINGTEWVNGHIIEQPVTLRDMTKSRSAMIMRVGRRDKSSWFPLITTHISDTPAIRARHASWSLRAATDGRGDAEAALQVLPGLTLAPALTWD